MGGQSSKVVDNPFEGFLDDSFVQSAETIIGSFSTGGGSLSSLEELMKFVVKVTLRSEETISQFKGKILENNELQELVKEFLDNSDVSLDLFTQVENRLRRARGNQLKLQIAIQKFAKGIKDDGSIDVSILSSTLNELDRFVTAGDPFDEAFSDLILATMERYKKMSMRLRDRINVLDKKLKRAKWWRNVSCGLMGSFAVEYLAIALLGFFLGIIPFLGAACFSGGAVAAAAVGVTAFCVHKKFKKRVEKERAILKTMDRANETSIVELKHINSEIESLKSKLEYMLTSGEVALDNRNDISALKTIMEPLGGLVSHFNKTVDSLCDQVDECRGNIIAARKAVLKDDHR